MLKLILGIVAAVFVVAVAAAAVVVAVAIIGFPHRRYRRGEDGVEHIYLSALAGELSRLVA